MLGDLVRIITGSGKEASTAETAATAETATAETATAENVTAFLEENPTQAKIIIDKCLRAARARFISGS